MQHSIDKYQENVNEWVKEFDKRITQVEDKTKLVEVYRQNQEVDLNTLHNLRDSLGELEDKLASLRHLVTLWVGEIRHMRKALIKLEETKK